MKQKAATTPSSWMGPSGPGSGCLIEKESQGGSGKDQCYRFRERNEHLDSGAKCFQREDAVQARSQGGRPPSWGQNPVGPPQPPSEAHSPLPKWTRKATHFIGILASDLVPGNLLTKFRDTGLFHQPTNIYRTSTMCGHCPWS
ncbi:hypothetical protein H1C71_029356 [Ictidomys tridecemlineatus]|nr:hypothetical protein H1C71_029356 [Ictidomys tridecemlineatus]